MWKLMALLLELPDLKDMVNKRLPKPANTDIVTLEAWIYEDNRAQLDIVANISDCLDEVISDVNPSPKRV